MRNRIHGNAAAGGETGQQMKAMAAEAAKQAKAAAGGETGQQMKAMAETEAAKQAKAAAGGETGQQMKAMAAEAAKQAKAAAGGEIARLYGARARRIARAAAVCTAAFCVALPVVCVPAFAATYGTGEVTVDNITGNETQFKAYYIFKANLNSDGTVSNIAWASTSVRSAVLGVIKAADPTYTSTNAQDAADYISAAYLNASGNLTTSQTTILENAELLNKIAAAVDDLTANATLTAGTAAQLSEGYWLIVTDGSTVGEDETGTAPIFTLSGGTVTINEKTSVPTVDKLILNDADSADYSYGAEAQVAQEISHKVTGTIANNFKTFSTYYYEFEDDMAEGIDYVSGSFAVKIDGTDVTSSFTAACKENSDKTRTLSVKCSDLLAISGVTLSADSKVVLTYRVKLNSDCTVGGAGNENDVKIIYSSNPNTSEKSYTSTVRDYLYTFAVHVEKKDRDTNVALAGAKFTIQATGADDTASVNKYVQANGTLGATAHEFTTDANGCIDVSGLDAGTYTLHETQAPEGYQIETGDTIFVIAASYGTDGTLSSLTNTVSGNADAVAGLDTTDDNVVNADADSAVNISTGTVNITVGNIEKIKMPLSGQAGTGLITAIGAAVTGISIACACVALKKRKEEKCAQRD